MASDGNNPPPPEGRIDLAGLEADNQGTDQRNLPEALRAVKALALGLALGALLVLASDRSGS